MVTQSPICVSGEISEWVQLVMLCNIIFRFDWLYREHNSFEAAEPRPLAGRIVVDILLPLHHFTDNCV